MNRFSVAVVTALLIVSAASVRADTLNMPMFAPVTFNNKIDMKYTIENTGAGGILGKFTAIGRAVSVDGVALAPAPGNGTFQLTAYFDRVTGEIIKDHATINTLDPLLEVKDASATTLYFSRHIRRFAYDLGTTYPTFDFEFFNEGGALTLLNPLDYIGATLRNVTTFSGTKSFVSNAAVGTVVFNNNLLGPIEGGTANVFMTPTPTALGGGAMLLCCIFLGGKLRRAADRQAD
jgi:hypothetical protein